MQDCEQEEAGSRQGRETWKTLLSGLAPLVGIGAIVLYALLSIGYHRFYGPLGVDPSDVGLTQGFLKAGQRAASGRPRPADPTGMRCTIRHTSKQPEARHDASRVLQGPP